MHFQPLCVIFILNDYYGAPEACTAFRHVIYAM